MSYFEAFILALVQGFTEFLPISSSAHLILPSAVLGWEDQGLAFDVAVHVGTLAAVVIYFRKEVVSLLSAFFGSVFKGDRSKEAKLAWMIILATIPACIFGLLMKDIVELYLRSAWVIATTTIIFGLLLWWVDKNSSLRDDEYQAGWKKPCSLVLLKQWRSFRVHLVLALRLLQRFTLVSHVKQQLDSLS